jgi:hypothetical protein
MSDCWAEALRYLRGSQWPPLLIRSVEWQQFLKKPHERLSDEDMLALEREGEVAAEMKDRRR